MSYTESKITRIGSHEFNFWGVRPTSLNGYDGFEITFTDDDECISDFVYTKEDANLIAAAPIMYETLKKIEQCESLDSETKTMITKAIKIANGDLY